MFMGEPEPGEPYPVTFPESKVELQVFATVQGRAVCKGNPRVTLDIVDRHVCSFFPLSEDGDGIKTHYPRDADFSVYGWNEGACTNRADGKSCGNKCRLLQHLSPVPDCAHASSIGVRCPL